MRPQQPPSLQRPAPLHEMAQDTMRVFFAVWPDAAASDSLATLARVVAEQTDGRAPRPENLHLTLVFVGDVPPKSVATLCAIGEAAATPVAPFTLMLDRIGTFRRAGIAWAGASVVPTGLRRMAQTLADMLAAQELPIERRTFEPHVTLARRCRKPCELPPGAPIAWTVNRLVLNVSELARGGARYRERGGWPLGGGHES